jgi:hypothetical protein
MRALLAVVLLSAIVAGCTPYIPVKDDFATTALAPPAGANAGAGGAIPPEFAEFNAYNPAVNGLLADQICATPYQPIEEQTRGSASGRLVEARGRCQTHVPLFGE